MLFSFHALLASSYCFSLAFSLPEYKSSSYGNGASSGPIPPSQDPFYTAPSGFESYAPGTILRLREAPGNLTTIIANSSKAYHILYRTTDGRYRPSWAVTTLVLPSSNTTIPTRNTSSLLSLQLAYNSADVDSSPSYALYSSLSQPSLDIPPATGDIAFALGQGWHVSIPDHEGPLASFGLGIQEGHATIDSVRAVLSSNLIPSPHTAKYAMWGYSGGSIASTWASELQEQYAPELSFSGMAIGGMVPNLTNAMDNITASAYAGLIPPLLLGLTSQYPDAYDYLVSRLKTSGPYNASYFLAAKHMDINHDFVAYAMQNVFDYFIGGRADLDAPIFQRISNTNGYQGYHGVPRMPVFAYKAIKDQFSAVKYSDALLERYCGVGADIWYQRNEIGGHVAEVTNGRLRALEWLKTVFDGSYDRKGCFVENVTVNITSNPE